MSVYSKALYNLRQSIAYALDDCVVCRVDANATTSTCANATLLKADDYYNGYDCRFYLGTHKDVTREVTDFVKSTGTVTFAPVVTNATDTTDYFELHRRFSTSQYNDAINRAIEMGKDEYLLDKKDETATLVTDTYEYAVPSGFRYISQIYREDTTDDDTYYVQNLIDSRKWWVVPVNATNSVIKFADNMYPIGSDLNGQKLRIIGQQLQSNLTNDADTCLLPSEFVIQQARAILLSQEKGSDERQAKFAQDRADAERRRMVIPPKGIPVFEI
uniref:Uncharacterized protein n=1 Tax=viral metagenome TaxID=1070528 RepID=A0A6M3IPJ6_9ZZZZ